MAQKRKHTLSGDDNTSSAVFQSLPIEDRSSTFTAYFSPTLPPRELQSLVEIKSASHKILAWRKKSAQQSLTPSRAQYTADHDDDGEKHGGKTVQKVLERMDVVGACVVGRWYGGVMLGPVRFEHMQTCAREAVQKWQDAENEQMKKKQKTESDELEFQCLLKVLVQRDQSVVVLRSLATEKEDCVKKAILAGIDDLQEKREEGGEDVKARVKATCEAAPSSSPSVPIDYSVMPLGRLKALERARDATLSFLLKRISKAEADLAAIESSASAA